MKGHLVGGKCYKYKVKIEKESLIIEGSDISDWQTDGETEDITVRKPCRSSRSPPVTCSRYLAIQGATASTASG